MKPGFKSNFKFLLFAFVLITTACVKDTISQLEGINSVEVNPQLSIPLVNDKMTIKDLYKTYASQANIIEGSDKFLSFLFESGDTLPQKQFITIPPVAIAYNMNMDQNAINAFNALGTLSNSITNNAPFTATNKERLKKIGVKIGNISVSISSAFKHNLSLKITYPSITKNGVALVDNINLNYTGTSPIVVNKTLDLVGYDIDMTTGTNGYNEIPYKLDFTLTKIAGSTTSLSDQLQINENVNIVDYSYIQGYLGKFTVIDVSSSQAFEIFRRESDGNVFIRNPRIIHKLNNNITAPITAKISNLSIETGNGSSYPVNVNLYKDTFTLAYPNINQKGQLIYSEYKIDSSNSNIATVFSRAPQSFFYSLNFIANYNENVNEDNYLTDNNKFYVTTDVELPIEIKILDYTVRDTGALSMTAIDNNLVLDWAKVTGSFQNYFPISSTLQFYFIKDDTINGVRSFKYIDSLYAEQISIPSGTVDANGKVFLPSSVINNTIMTGERYANLCKTANKYVLLAKMHTAEYLGNYQWVKVYSDQTLSFKLGVEVKGTYKAKLK